LFLLTSLLSENFDITVFSSSGLFFCWAEDLDLWLLILFYCEFSIKFSFLTVNPWFSKRSSQSNTTNNVVRLSKERFSIALVITFEAAFPMKASFSLLFSAFNFKFSFLKFQNSWETFSFYSLSKMPSEPIMIKSCSAGSIVKYVIYGLAIKTLGFPPNSGFLASISPKDLETDSFPGSILKGP